MGFEYQIQACKARIPKFNRRQEINMLFFSELGCENPTLPVLDSCMPLH
jgi:hypothetical protein